MLKYILGEIIQVDTYKQTTTTVVIDIYVLHILRTGALIDTYEEKMKQNVSYPPKPTEMAILDRSRAYFFNFYF